MTTIWEHRNPVHITAGIGAFERLCELVPEGQVLLVTTAGFTRRGVTAQVVAQLGGDRVSVYDQVTPNPELDVLDAITRELRNARLTSIVALGGGSVLDTGKVLGVTLVSESEWPLDKVLRQGCPQSWARRLPVIAIPTTSGTGAEVTSFATVWDRATHKKHSVTGDNLYPIHALLDPSLTLTLPSQLTLYTGLDTISHALESLWNKNRTPVSEAFALQALKLATNALPVVLEEPENLEQRACMQQAGVLAGLAISQTRTAISHSISYPLTSHFGVPHGLACSFTLVSIALLIREKAPTFLSAYEPVITKVVSLLDALALHERIMQFVDREGIKAMMPEMITKERSDNFIFPIDSAILRTILDSVQLW